MENQRLRDIEIKQQSQINLCISQSLKLLLHRCCHGLLKRRQPRIDLRFIHH